MQFANDLNLQSIKAGNEAKKKGGILAGVAVRIQGSVVTSLYASGVYLFGGEAFDTAQENAKQCAARGFGQ